MASGTWAVHRWCIVFWGGSGGVLGVQWSCSDGAVWCVAQQLQRSSGAVVVQWGCSVVCGAVFVLVQP
eukprot:scaffold193026_cov18-Tisochrysis_lutea.AAC.2